jgi:ribosome-binding factor A
MTRRRPSGARHYPRTARLNELLREIAADTLERLDDERLGMLTVTGVEVDAALDRAVVYYSSLAELDPADDDTAEALDRARREVQRQIGRQARVRRTPEVVLRADAVIEEAARIEEILRGLDEDT